jgi:hypothetical protein
MCWSWAKMSALFCLVCTLNLSFLNLEHVIYKQRQINAKYSFKFVFLLHVLISEAEKQLFPLCKPLFVIWIQVNVIFNFIYICSCYKYLCCIAKPPPSPPAHRAVYTVPQFLMCEADGWVAYIQSTSQFISATLKFAGLVFISAKNLQT